MVNQTYGGTTNMNSSSSSEQNKKIFLGGLSYNTTDETLRAFCSRFGKMTDCVVMRTSEGKSRGFGFVTYEDASSVEDFMRSRPHTIDNRQIDSKRAMPREDQNSTESHLTVKKLFVAGLRDGIDEACLRQYFSRFGNVTEILVMNDRDGKPRGFAFVSFDDYDAVDKVILEKPHLVNGRTLDVKKAVPKEKMQEGSNPTGTNSGTSFPRNYSGSGQRNNFSSMRDNNEGWDNQNYNQPPPPPSSSYGQQGYNSNGSGFNPSNTGAFPSLYNSMEQIQPPPPPPMPQQPMMNYNSYNTNPNMPFNNNVNQPSTPNFMPPSYGSNQQQGYGTNPNSFNNMNNPFQLPSQQTNSSSNVGGYNSGSSMPNLFDNSNSYGVSSQNYNDNGINYNDISQQESRGGGSMRGKRGRGGGPSGNNNSPNFSNRSAPYPKRGNSRGGGGGVSNYGGRGRGRGQ
ncbi:unnamed protein product [Rotaria sp. Silwood2]|nr:unnamed protein product [Rotaria sp. Silwood2]CAF3927298.1 unnamed protein product [Rotaria sp. Silwood2]CAF4376060.1 unnamed protein product [Rotaria sp. Silwood2]